MRWFSRPETTQPLPQVDAPYNPDHEPPPLEDEIQRASAANRLLNDPTLAQVFKEIRVDLYAQWYATDPADEETRQQLYYEAHALDKVTRKLIAYRAVAQVRAA